ncbi:MAG: hypothetical protein ACOYYU_09500 [Chloroflexota bacterium]
MEIWHRIAINSGKDAIFYNTITSIGIRYKSQELPGGKSKLIFFDIAESDPYWTEISKLIATYGASDIADTFFEDKEVRNAEWLRLVPTFEQGYPQPKLHWPLKQLSFEIICSSCALRQQISNMRIIKEPNLGKKSFMSLIWCGEIFCTSEVFESLGAIGAKGYEAWDVLLHKSEQPSSKVKQLYVPNIAHPGLIVGEELQSVKCPTCGTVKYYPHMKGAMQINRNALLSGLDFMLTSEWFGSGYIAFREILISNRIAQLILDKAWQGSRLKVVEVV